MRVKGAIGTLGEVPCVLALPTTAMGADGKTVSPQPALYSDNFLLFIVVIVALVAASVVAVVSYLGKDPDLQSWPLAPSPTLACSLPSQMRSKP